MKLASRARGRFLLLRREEAKIYRLPRRIRKRPKCISAEITKNANEHRTSGKKLTPSKKDELIRVESDKYSSTSPEMRAKPSKQYAAALGSIVNDVWNSYFSLLTSSATANAFMDSTANAINDMQSRETTRGIQETSAFTYDIAKKKKDEKDDQDGKSGTGFA